jgi:two-component system chemotaxis response regulator CheY
MSKRVLIVDDSKIVRKVTRQMLEPLNFHIEEAEDGAQAVITCERWMPDLILLDHNMPNMDGMESLARIRSMPGGDIPVIIFCTTENEMSFITKAVLSGANEFVMKPFDADILFSKLQQVGILPSGE